MGGRLVSAALTAASDVVRNELPHVRPVVLAGDEVKSAGGAIVACEWCVMVGGSDGEPHGLRDVNSAPVIEDAVFQLSWVTNRVGQDVLC